MSDSTPAPDAPSKPRRRFRRVRIAVSVFFGVLTVALCVLWVRSYWYIDRVIHSVHSGTYAAIESTVGRISVARQTSGNHLPSFTGYSRIDLSDLPRMRSGEGQFNWSSSRAGRHTISFPHCLIVVLSAVVAISCWIPINRRFSLRTMLIATTFVAVVLGLGVWLAS